jgi:hypothetical protein
MGLKGQFATDQTLETKGIVIDYGDDRIRIARAGGGNKAFVRLLEAKTKPLRRAIAVGALDNDRSLVIMREIYADTIILGWEVNVGTMTIPEWKSGIRPSDAGVEAKDDNELLPVNKENILKVFNNLPDLFIDIQQQASAGALFRAEINEQSAGN